MRTHSFSDNTLHTALAALVGVATAAVVKLLLDENAGPAPASLATAPHRPTRQAKLDELKAAAQDPLYLADMQAVNDDFAFVDAEQL